MAINLLPMLSGFSAGEIVVGVLSIAAVLASIIAAQLAVDHVLHLLRDRAKERAYLRLPRHMIGQRMTRTGTAPIHIRRQRVKRS